VLCVFISLLNIAKSTMAVPMLSIKTHVAKSSVLFEKAYQHEKARKEQAKRAHGAVLCEVLSTTANFRIQNKRAK